MNTNAMDTFTKIDNIKNAIFEAKMFALENHDLELHRELDKLSNANDVIWWREMENAYPETWKVGA